MGLLKKYLPKTSAAPSIIIKNNMIAAMTANVLVAALMPLSNASVILPNTTLLLS